MTRSHIYSFSDCLDEICMCGKDIESTNHFLLLCSLFFKEKQFLMNKIRDIDSSFIDQNENSLCHTLLLGKENMNDSDDAHILNATIEYILSIERFNVQSLVNLSLSLQLITTTIINDSILFELTSPFCFFLFSLLFRRYTK